MSKVRLEQISKKFDHLQAVSDLSFEIEDGEFVVLLGPTGAGKTTTLRLIAGLEKADSGSIYINDQNVTELQPALRDVAFVFQQYSLYPNYTVYNNLAFPLRSPMRNLSKKEIDEKVRHIAKVLHIESKLNNQSTNLSGGEMQRVAIGRALVRNPNIFLMDEPLSSLDSKLRAELRLELKNIQINLGATLLYVTHDHVEATTMGDRIGILEEGKLVQLDTPENIYKKPNSIYVAKRLGSPKINVLPVHLIQHDLSEKVKYVGFRPEDVVLEKQENRTNGNETTEDTKSLNINTATHAKQIAEVQGIQSFGVEKVISMDFEGEKILAVVKPEEEYQLHQKIHFSVAGEHLLFFDDATQRIEL